MVNLRDLQYLVAIAEHCHFGKAAIACHVSQPALSMQIKKLEELLGVQLIERTNKSVLITAIGESIVACARDILERTEAMQDIAKQLRDPYSGEISLGVIPTLAPYLLPHIISGLSLKFPKLDIYLIEEQTSNLLEKLKQGKIAVALIALPLIEENLAVLPLFEEEFQLAVSTMHPLAKRKMIKHTDLENKSLFLLEEGHCMREQALSFCHSVHASEVKKFRATSLETLKHMVAANIGITLMPKLSCHPRDNICYLPFNKYKPTRTIGMVWRVASSKTALFKAMVKQIKILLSKNNKVKIINTEIMCGKS